MFDLNQLRCFVAVAGELHFGRAAVRLNMTQPPLSRQIRILEHIIGTPLLERTSRSVRLTAAGRGFLPEAKHILKLAETASDIARRIAAGKTGSLRLGFTAATAYGFLPYLIAACRTRLSEVDLSLKEMVSSDQLDALVSGQIDAGLLRPPVTRPELASKRVLAEPLLAALPAKHPLARASSLSIKDLDGHPFVMYEPYDSRYFHDLLVALFTRANILPRYVQNLSQIHSILALVRAGLGVSVVPAAALNLNIAGVRLRPLRLRIPKPVETIMVWRRDSDNPLLPTLLETAADLAKRRRHSQ